MKERKKCLKNLTKKLKQNQLSSPSMLWAVYGSNIVLRIVCRKVDLSSEWKRSGLIGVDGGDDESIGWWECEAERCGWSSQNDSTTNTATEAGYLLMICPLWDFLVMVSNMLSQGYAKSCSHLRSKLTTVNKTTSQLNSQINITNDRLRHMYPHK